MYTNFYGFIHYSLSIIIILSSNSSSITAKVSVVVTVVFQKINENVWLIALGNKWLVCIRTESELCYFIPILFVKCAQSVELAIEYAYILVGIHNKHLPYVSIIIISCKWQQFNHANQQRSLNCRKCVNAYFKFNWNKSNSKWQPNTNVT